MQYFTQAEKVPPEVSKDVRSSSRDYLFMIYCVSTRTSSLLSEGGVGED
jgi:hypothetical protein